MIAVLRQPGWLAGAAVLGAGLGGLLLLRTGVTVQGVAALPLLAALAVVSVLDLSTRTIPDVITIPGLLYGLLLSLGPGPSTPREALLGVLVGGGVPLVLALVSRGGIGGGDVKLLAMLGAVLGWRGVMLAFVLSQVAALVAIAVMSAARRRLVREVPVGALIAVLGGVLLVSRYGEP